MTKTVTSRTIAVEHIRISSERPFAEVRRRLEGAVPRLDAGIAAPRNVRSMSAIGGKADSLCSL